MSTITTICVDYGIYFARIVSSELIVFNFFFIFCFCAVRIKNGLFVRFFFIEPVSFDDILSICIYIKRDVKVSRRVTLFVPTSRQWHIFIGWPELVNSAM